MPGPLEGVKVLDLTTVFSGPYATVLLGDLGADVIKVEAPGGDIVRRIGPSPAGVLGPLFMAVGRNKRCVCLDLKSTGGQEVFGRLVDWADVLVHNMRPSAAARVGADAAPTRARNPRLVHCVVAGFGSDGPYADLPAYDDVVQAASGMAALQSVDPDRLTYIRSVAADKTSGLMAFGAISAALFQRERTGEGCEVEVPMHETFTSFVLLEHLYGLTFEPPVDQAGYPRTLAPDRRPFRTSDGWLSVVVYDDRHWAGFFSEIGRPDLTTDPRFADHRSRTSHSGPLYGIVAEAMATRTTEDWLAALRRLDIPAMPVATVPDLLEDPHLREVGLFELRPHPVEGTYRKVRNPLRYSTGLDDDRVPPATIGQHNHEVLAELGYSDKEMHGLIEQGAVRG